MTKPTIPAEMDWSEADNEQARFDGWQILNGALFRSLDPFRKTTFKFQSISDVYAYIRATATKSEFHHRAYMLLPWMPVDKQEAYKEGWQISSDGLRIFSIHKGLSDEEAIEEVRNKAAQGSPMHLKAISIYARRHLTQDSSPHGHSPHY